MNIYFGEKLKELRLGKKLTQEKLAEFLGVSFQSISKWERGDTYPDITMLPDIASYFNVSIDDLLGINKAKNEEEIRKRIREYDNLTDDRLIEEQTYELIEKYPNDFRIQLRYMGFLVFYNKIDDNASKILSIYENIQQNCTVDSIRICAKRYYIHFYELLSKRDDSVFTFDDCEKIIKEMPRMRDGREMYCFSYPADHPERDEVIREAIEEEVFLLENTLDHYYFWDERFSLEYKIEILERIIDSLNFLYDDGNYSRMWRKIMYCHGHLGHFYFKNGDIEKSLLNLRKCAELADKFDALDRITVLHSTLFEGKKFDKQCLGSNYVAKSQIKQLMTERYPLSDEFKNTDEFRKIIEMLS